MKTLIAVLAILCSGTAFASPACPPNYPWCPAPACSGEPCLPTLIPPCSNCVDAGTQMCHCYTVADITDDTWGGRVNPNVPFYYDAGYSDYGQCCSQKKIKDVWNGSGSFTTPLLPDRAQCAGICGAWNHQVDIGNWAAVDNECCSAHCLPYGGVDSGYNTGICCSGPKQSCQFNADCCDPQNGSCGTDDFQTPYYWGSQVCNTTKHRCCVERDGITNSVVDAGFGQDPVDSSKCCSNQLKGDGVTCACGQGSTTFTVPPGSCFSDNDCCIDGGISGHACVNNFCGCVPKGFPPTVSTNCCSTVEDVNGACSCYNYGAACTSSAQCCGEACGNAGASNGKCCAPNGDKRPTDGIASCRAGHPEDCCSNNCIILPDGGTACTGTYTPLCKALGMTCTVHSDCCSKVCSDLGKCL